MQPLTGACAGYPGYHLHAPYAYPHQQDPYAQPYAHPHDQWYPPPQAGMPQHMPPGVTPYAAPPQAGTYAMLMVSTHIIAIVVIQLM